MTPAFFDVGPILRQPLPRAEDLFGGLMTNRPGTSHERMSFGSFPFRKSGKVERGNGHGGRNIDGFYVAAEGDGESSGGLPADLS